MASIRPYMRTLIFFSLLMAQPLVAFETPSPPSLTKGLVFAENSKSVYKINPLLDWSVIAVSAGSAIYLNVNPAPYIWRTCPCDPNSVNHFDRPAIFNYNPGLYTAANITLLASIAAPIAFDAADLGFSKEFNEDMVVFLEVLSVDQAVMNTLKFIIK